MRHSSTGATRVLTIVTLTVLSSLSFSLVDAQNVVDTPHRRAIQHLRLRASSSPALTPTSSASPTPSQSPDTPTKSIPTSLPSSSSSTPSSTLTPSSTDSSTPSAQSSSSSQPSDTTSSTPTPTSTSSQSSSTPTSTSSPSNTSSSPSSSSTSTSSTTPVAIAPNHVSTTPLASSSPVSNDGFSLSSDGGSTVFAAPTAGATSKGFFANKAAVAATFSIIGIILGLAAIIGAVTMIKRYRRSRDDDDEFYEKYSGAPGTHHSRSQFSRDLGHSTLGASATDLSIDAAPPEAYPDRAVHYGQSNPNVFRPVDYGIDYPPQAANPNAAAAANQRNSTDIAYEQYDYDPNRRSTSAGSHPFADPANAPRTAAAPPVAYPRTVQGRAQEMVTVDSYYGPNSAGVGAAAGYAQ